MPTRKWEEEQLVNTTLVGLQFSSDVAALAGGGFVVVWEDESAGSDGAIRAQRFDPTGAKVGAEILVYSSSGFIQEAPTVTGLSDGSFWVSWRTERSDANFDITGKIFNANGTERAWFEPIPFNIFSPDLNNQTEPDILRLGAGLHSVAVWNDLTSSDISYRVFDAAGTATNVMTANTTTVGIQEDPAVAAAWYGAFTVVWHDAATDDIRARTFNSVGTPENPTDFLVNVVTQGSQSDPSVAWLPGGGFVVVWQDESGLGSRIKARVMASNDGPEILVNSSGGSVSNPVVAALPNGGFAVAWWDFTQGGLDHFSIRLQVFDGAGGKIGGEIVVNTDSSASAEPSITPLADGRIVVSWTDDYYFGGDHDIRMQIIDPRDGLVTGTPGNDSLYGHALVNDEISGGAGHDSMSGLGGSDGLYGGDGNDTLVGGKGDDLGFGGAGNDIFSGGSGEDEFKGGGGNDLMNFSPGADVFNGGAGIDTASYSAATTTVKVTLNGAALVSVQVGGVVKDTVRNVESVYGGTANDTLTGDNLANTFIGFGGNDSLVGVGGNDFLRGGLGNDTLNGGTGFDTAYYSDKAATVAVTLNASSLVTVLVGGVAEDRIVNIEAVTGGSGNDTLGGDSFANRLTGGGGADRLNGAAGNDTLIGGAGADLLIGSTGADRFDFDLTTETPVGGSDTVSDFSRSQADKIDLAGIDAIAGGADNPFVFVGTVAFSAAGQIRAVQSGAHTILELNTSGAGGAEAAILLSNFTAATLASTDFVL